MIDTPRRDLVDRRGLLFWGVKGEEEKQEHFIIMRMTHRFFLFFSSSGKRSTHERLSIVNNHASKAKQSKNNNIPLVLGLYSEK